jgi:hypothetical protein
LRRLSLLSFITVDPGENNHRQNTSMKKKEATCYMCDASSVGGEHVPPKCLFPDEPRFRKSFVKVPSCAQHNTGKSTDDEFLRWVLAATNANSEIAQHVLSKGVAPSFVKRPHLRETFLRDFQFRVREGGMFKSILKLDFKRFHNSITSIVRGLYYHHTWYSHKALGPMDIMWDGVQDKEIALQALNVPDQEYEAFIDHLPPQPNCPLGDNPDVFRYGFDFESNPKRVRCFLRFYGGKAIIVDWDNGEREYRTYLKSVKDYFDKFGSGELQGTAAEQIHQIDERDAHLVSIMKESRHKRDFSAFSLAKMIRKDLSKKSKQLQGQ